MLVEGVEADWCPCNVSAAVREERREEHYAWESCDLRT